MEPHPVSQHPCPAYPTRREFLAAGAAVAAAGLSGCGVEGAPSPLVAPIFVHGEGRGATGCVVIAPPVFLSEEEALQVIKEELAQAGIALGRGMPLPEVVVEYEDPNLCWLRSGDNWLGEPVAKVSRPADLAAVDPQRQVGVEIVTTAECNRFSGGVLASAVSYDTKGLAECVAEGIRRQAQRALRIGVFYDPLERWSFDAGEAEPADSKPADPRSRWEQATASAEEKSRTQLRRQAQDFLAWLQKNP